MSLGLIDTPKGQPNKEERIDGIVDKTHNKAGNNLNLSKVWETVGNRSTWHAAVHGVTKSQTRPRDCTTATTNLEREEGKGKSIKN